VLGNLTYEYDNVGNRSKTGGSWARIGVPQNVTTTSYGANNRQLTFGDKTLAYDDNGNLQTITDSSGTTIYSWNARNQLVGISGPNVNASFVYDAAGRRQKKTIGGNTTEFLYDGVNPVQETSGATILANMLTGLGIDDFFTRTDVGTGVTSNLLTDALGSTIALADSAGTVQTENTYEPFGKTTSTGASNTNPFQYTGRENDGTGLYYYRARYYHSGLQRFISGDPIGFDGGDFNLYAYVANSPVNFLDPYGLSKDDCLRNCASALRTCRNAVILLTAACSIAVQFACRGICSPLAVMPPLYLSCVRVCLVSGRILCAIAAAKALSECYDAYERCKQGCQGCG